MVFGLRRICHDIRGGIALLAALALPVVLGAAGLAFDVNRGLDQRILNQRAADLASLGAAMAYKSYANSSVLQPTAQDIAKANGLTGATVSATLVSNYPSSGSQSVKVQVTTSMPFNLARVLGLRASYNVVATSYASLTSQPQYATPCFLALYSGSSALITSGGGTISAPSCSIAAVGEVSNGGSLMSAHDIISGSSDIANNYGTLTAQTLRFATSFNNPSWNGNVPTSDKRINQSTTLIDPWSNSTALSDARSLLGSYTSVPTLTNPTTSSGSNWSFDYNHTGAVAGYWQGSGKYVVPAGNYTIGSMSVAGGVTVTFQDGSNITIANGFSNGGSSVNFGNANLYVNGGFNSGSSGVTIGSGTLWIGSGTVTFTGTNVKGDGNVMINALLNMGGGQTLKMGAGAHSFGGITLGGGGSVTMGAGAFTSTGGITIGGGSELSIGNGNVLIGHDSSNYAINLAGSARFFMGDGTFSANGNIVTAGGSRLAFGATANHYINGNMTIAGSALFGQGRYTINGNFTNGTGGTTWPYTSSLNSTTYGSAYSGFDMGGSNVTFILAGTLNLAGGAKTKLIASTSTASGGEIADMLVTSLTTATTSWSAGSANVFVGTVYLPKSAVTMSGGSTTLSSGQCFTLIANTIAATGGAAAGSACATMDAAYGGGSSASTIKLVN